MLSGICMGVIALLLAGGFVEWIFWAMRESTVLYRSGHVQVMRPGYLEQGAVRSGEFVMPNDAPELAGIRADARVKSVSPRLSFSGLISHGETTVACLGEGIDPGVESQLNKPPSIVKGQGLREGAEGAVVGIGLAENLGLSVGEKVVLLANTPAGGINAVEVDVVGLFTTSNKAFDESAVRVSLSTAERLVKVSGAQRWIVVLHDTDKTDEFLVSLKTLLSNKGQDYQAIAWHELDDFYAKTVTLFSSQMNVLGAIIGFMIVLGISNSQIMSVMDRTSEIGTLLALGRRRRDVLWLFLSESFWLALVGSILGGVLGWGLATVISIIGIPMPPAPGTNTRYTAEIMVTLPLALKSTVLAFCATCLAGVVPAWKAARMPIVDSLRKAR